MWVDNDSGQDKKMLADSHGEQMTVRDGEFSQALSSRLTWNLAGHIYRALVGNRRPSLAQNRVSHRRSCIFNGWNYAGVSVYGLYERVNKGISETRRVGG